MTTKFADVEGYIAGFPPATQELAGYKTAKGSVQFPLNAPLPAKLITRMVQFRVQEE